MLGELVKLPYLPLPLGWMSQKTTLTSNLSSSSKCPEILFLPFWVQEILAKTHPEGIFANAIHSKIRSPHKKTTCPSILPKSRWRTAPPAIGPISATLPVIFQAPTGGFFDDWENIFVHTPTKTNEYHLKINGWFRWNFLWNTLSPQKWWLENYFPLEMVPFLGTKHVHFRWGNQAQVAGWANAKPHGHTGKNVYLLKGSSQFFFPENFHLQTNQGENHDSCIVDVFS